MKSKLATVLIAALAACGGTNVKQAKSDLARVTAPNVSAADAEALVTGNTAFAADLFRVTRDEKNFMVSPHSVSLALAMTWAGARGETETAMASALRFGLGQAQLHPAFDQLDLALASRGQGSQGKDGKPFRLAINNAVWAQDQYGFEQAFLDTLAANYGAGVNLLDFAGAPEPSRTTINDWVSEKTEGKIKDLLAKGTITDLTRMVLTNTVYFNAAWSQKFDTNQTANGSFVLPAGASVSVPLMHGEVSGKLLETTELTAAELPYDGGEVSMVVVVPKGPLEAFEATLDGPKLQAIGRGLQPETFQATLPRFKFEGKASLKDALSKLGMEIAFTDRADFTGLHTPSELSISDVIHQTFVAVDEAGTEAAAATAVILDTRGVAATKVFRADRPFLFFIRDVATGSVLFLGHVVDPR